MVQREEEVVIDHGDNGADGDEDKSGDYCAEEGGRW